MYLSVYGSNIGRRRYFVFSFSVSLTMGRIVPPLCQLKSIGSIGSIESIEFNSALKEKETNKHEVNSIDLIDSIGPIGFNWFEL